MKAIVTINGAPVALYFGMPAALQAMQDKDVIEQATMQSFGILPTAAVLHAGYVNQCLIERVPETLNYTDFYFYAETAVIDNLSEEAQKAVDAFIASRSMQKFIAAGAPKQESETEEKKSEAITQDFVTDNLG